MGVDLADGAYSAPPNPLAGLSSGPQEWQGGKKGKVDLAPLGHRWDAHLPLIAFEPVGG